jgi:peptidyl-prolyl cis-trans isomerase C
MEEAASRIDSSRGSYDRQMQEYISYWISTEVVYQEALKEGVDKSPEIQRQIEEIRKQLVNRLYLDKQMESDTAGISDQEIAQYYEQHKQEFFLREDMIRLNIAAFHSREQASRFGASISKAGNWQETVQHFSADSASSGDVISFNNNQYHSQQTLFPPELWKVASALSPNEVSFPVKTSLGYFILQSLSYLKRGAEAEFEFVKDEVRQRFLRERHRERYTQLLGTLRKKYDVEVYVTNTQSSDSLEAPANE